MLFLSTTFLSYMAAYVLFLLVECPVGNIEKYLLMPKAALTGPDGGQSKDRNGHSGSPNGHQTVPIEGCVNGSFRISTEKLGVDGSLDKVYIVERF